MSKAYCNNQNQNGTDLIWGGVVYNSVFVPVCILPKQMSWMRLGEVRVEWNAQKKDQISQATIPLSLSTKNINNSCRCGVCCLKWSCQIIQLSLQSWKVLGTCADNDLPNYHAAQSFSSARHLWIMNCRSLEERIIISAIRKIIIKALF